MYRVSLTEFEGPLDLLLFFIKRDELDIYDIPIAHITKSFMEYLDAMQELNLEVAADFIYMASVLMSIKAKMLLPRPESPSGELDEFDPRTELVQKLLEYKRFKEMALHLQLLEEDRRKLFPRLAFEQIEASEIEDETKRPTLFDLIRAYQIAMKNIPKTTVHEIKRIPVTIEQQTEFLLKKLDERIQISFLETVREFAERITIVVTFLAILEMAKARLVNLIVRDDCGDFWLAKANLAS
ncbi:MAG: segregation/condensation protein A [Chloroherpetonaceae bacterium]|nr:segregation/condensation protein A [Chloroherpetonaceae bacterium]MDW8436556.1 segregation/condensation protein A [Chloroherpetonaceae bacterium]